MIKWPLLAPDSTDAQVIFVKLGGTMTAAFAR